MISDSHIAESVWHETLGNFTDRVASRKPTPGGGAVAALSACFGAALLEMALEIAAKGGYRRDRRAGACPRGIKRIAALGRSRHGSFQCLPRCPQAAAAHRTGDIALARQDLAAIISQIVDRIGPLMLNLIGTFVFGVSGGILAVRKQMDLFGVLVLSVVAALGGGMMRDVLLGHTPPRNAQ